MGTSANSISERSRCRPLLRSGDFVRDSADSQSRPTTNAPIRTVTGGAHDIWQQTATAWLVCDFLLMPDHLHLFCAPRDLEVAIERWMAFWKDRLAKLQPEIGAFQRGGFHHRLRTGESYSRKWQYVRENPVRAGLVDHPGDWPYQGRVHEIL